MSKIRLDIYLYEEGYFDSREKAKRNIMAKNVLINDEPKIKPGELIDPKNIKSIRVKDKCPYVSRAGLKLAKAIEVFNLDLTNKVMLDVGSSTGGFVDCALQNGIGKVVALDVGTNQLAYKLRNHKQVKVFEQTNFRTIPNNFFKDKFDIITMDVSFISSLLLVENVYNNLKDDGIFILLIKPQFEAGIEVKRNKHGVIVNQEDINRVKNEVVNKIKDYGFKCIDVINSPIKGAKGNQEFLSLFVKNKGENNEKSN